MDEATEPQSVEDVAREAQASAVERDKIAVEQWKALAAEAPSVGDTTALAKRAAELADELEAARLEHARACVRRAVVYGWVRVSQEQGVSAKQLHAWHKQLLPDVHDLSEIPNREMRREEKRIANLERRMENEKQLRAHYRASQKRLAELKKGVSDE